MRNICDPRGTVGFIPVKPTVEQLQTALEVVLHERMMEATQSCNPQFKGMARALAEKMVELDEACGHRINADSVKAYVISHPSNEECDVFRALQEHCHFVASKKEKSFDSAVYHYLKVHIGKLYAIIAPGAAQREWEHSERDSTSGGGGSRG